jgi:hypothetical protein
MLVRATFEASTLGAACRTRTDDLLITNELLWPTELRRQCTLRTGGTVDEYTCSAALVVRCRARRAEGRRNSYLQTVPSAGTAPVSR